MNLRTAFVSLLALSLVAWFLRHANIADVWTQVRHARMDLLILGFIFVMATYWARAVRWQYLLAPVGHTRFRTVLRTTVIGFAALAILPARVGDVLRPYLLARREGLATTATMATVVMERVLDLITVLILLAIYVWGFTGDSHLPDRLLNPVKVSATLAGAAEMTRQRISMFDAEQFVYHRRFLDQATTAANEAAVHRAMTRGREMSAAEAAEFALANVAGD